ncbi:MAG: hypothetical protein ACR2LK_09855 [Solirubrobacteraceae bacterium]
MLIATYDSLRAQNQCAMPATGIVASWPREKFAPLTIDTPSGD